MLSDINEDALRTAYHAAKHGVTKSAAVDGFVAH